VNKKRGQERRDFLALILEGGLLGVIVLAPLPFGSVAPAARLALELAALLLLVTWLARAFIKGVELPPPLVWLGIMGLLGLSCLQTLPLPSAVLGVSAPKATEIRRDTEPGLRTRLVEASFLDVDEERFEVAGTLSVDPAATASALRGGIALAALLLVAVTVAATRGVRRLALALLISAAFQGLYGLSVLVSGHDRIWHVPKQYGLNSATGTFINRNHFACLLAMSLACGAGLILSNIRNSRAEEKRSRVLAWFSPAGSRNLLLGLLLVVGLAGLLLSFSRAGIALGLFALCLTLVFATGSRGVGNRVIVAVLVIAAAGLPLAQIGSDRLIQRFERSAEDLQNEGGRLTVWKDTVRIAADFPLFGTGYGTFAEVYPTYRSPEVRKFYLHTHNDGLQAIAEGGIVGAGFLILLALPVVTLTAAGLRGAKGTLGVGFAAGLSAVLLHSLVDFPFHIPATAATAAILGGALMGMPWSDRD